MAANANELTSYQNWRVVTASNAIEAYTSPNVNSTFGLYCRAGQCIFYLFDRVRCQSGSLTVHTYNLHGSNLAVNRALSEAARNVKQSPAQPKVKPPSIEPIPGAKKLQDIKT